MLHLRDSTHKQLEAESSNHQTCQILNKYFAFFASDNSGNLIINSRGKVGNEEKIYQLELF